MRDRSVYMEYNFALKNPRKGKFPTGYQIIKVSKDLPNRLMEFLDDFNKGENGVSGPNVAALNSSIESYINKLMDMENPEKLQPGYVAESNY